MLQAHQAGHEAAAQLGDETRARRARGRDRVEIVRWVATPLLPLRRLRPAVRGRVGVGGEVALRGEARRVGVRGLGREGGELLVQRAAAAVEVVAQ